MNHEPPQTDRTLNNRDILLIVALNLLPIAGVLLWDWHSFDLIFLYWMENLVIGGLLRCG